MRGRKKSPDTRVAILGCAAEVFAEREYHEVLTDDIAAKLGIGKGTIYRYFDSKEELYFATIVEGLKGMHEAITAALQQPAPLAVVLERLVRTILEYFWTRRDFFILLHRHEPKLDPEERAEWQQQRDEVVDRVRDILEHALPRGSVGRKTPRLAVEILLGMIRSACLFREPDDRPERLAPLITSVFLNGIKANPATLAARDPAARGSRPAQVGAPSLTPLRGGRARS
jgi:AcrR family transcriptional regulator